ncbi:axonemal dynein light chain domain-containing protein [Ditylenchus destructor]|uniref:Axonemal dynein light chain domain-containing protein n=1 Tax=Ditylenchus destructor TaxID=166010 RepID=A0AAD4R4W0_9BILA|nr:axonemal dynein light chain domain-containing protein [Ditylenchus destructor]
MSRLGKGLVQRNQPEVISRQGDDQDDEEKTDFLKVSECMLPPINPDKHLQSIMDAILPPRKTEHKGQTWLERASTVPATRLDLLALEEKFETELQQKKAKTFGICPIRRQIYDEIFDELIRQVTINCAERGLMLLRVRDEMRLTILSYQGLLESAIAYGIRKAILVEKQQSEAVVERDEERQKNVDLSAQLEQLQKQLAQERLVKEEEVRLLEQTMKDENERLLESNKMHLQAILQMDQQLQQQQSSLANPATVDTQAPKNTK